MNQADEAIQPAALLVCLGNIRRSPAAEAILRKMVTGRGLERSVELDSTGAGNYYIGEAPDSRAVRAGQTRGYSLEALRARQVTTRDFEKFDYVLAMDESHSRALPTNCPAHFYSELDLMLDYSDSGLDSAPDPHWSTDKDFAEFIELLEPACEELPRHILACSRERPAAI